MRKKPLVLITTLIFMLAACSTPSSQAPVKTENTEEIVIGAFIGLSGDTIGYGEAQKKGIELAASEINGSDYLGKGRKIKVVIADAGSTGASAMAAVSKLIETEKVSGLIGPTLSSQAFPADPIAQKSGIPVIAISNTVPGITEMGNYIFRCSLPESTVIVETIRTAASQLGVSRVAYLWGKDDDYTVAGYKAFKSGVDVNGLHVLADESFSRSDTDFKAQLSRIIALNPDAILVSALAREAALIIVQARSLGYAGTIIGGNGFNSQDVIKQAGNDAEGVITGTAWDYESINQRNLKFISAFQKSYGTKPDQFATQAYTGVWLYAYAIRNASSSNPKVLRDSLAEISNFTTPLGSFSFTGNREPVHPSIVQIILNGKFKVFNP